jgi:hypothetical protein
MRLVFPVCQVTLAVTSVDVPPALAVAFKHCVPVAVELTGSEMELGWTLMAVTFPKVTVAVVVPVAVPDDAVMLVVPAEIPFSSPPVLMVATVGVELDQHTVVPAQLVPPVRVTAFPLLSVPAAVNCLVSPWLTFGFGGLIVMLVMVGLTKNPRQATPKAAIASTPTAPIRRSLSFLDDIV